MGGGARSGVAFFAPEGFEGAAGWATGAFCRFIPVVVVFSSSLHYPAASCPLLVTRLAPHELRDGSFRVPSLLAFLGGELGVFFAWRRLALHAVWYLGRGGLSWCLLGASSSSVPPRCLLGAPWVPPGASWVHPGQSNALLVSPSAWSILSTSKPLKRISLGNLLMAEKCGFHP